MQVVVAQHDIVWEDPAANYAAVERLLGGATVRPGALIVLPEMFSTGFSMKVERVAEGHPSRAEVFLSSLSRRCGCWTVAGVVFRTAAGMGRNCVVVHGPDGARLGEYQKNHGFSYAKEDLSYQNGEELFLFEWNGLRVCPTICYDLRFPELYRRGVEAGAELFTVSANWPQARIEHWRTLLKARAIENQAFVVGANRVGRDPQLAYGGCSAVIDAKGGALAEAGTAAELLAVEIEPEALRDWRAHFPALRDRKTL